MVASDDRDLRDKSLADAAERIDADDQADADHARDHAEQFSRRHRLVAGDGEGSEQEGEDRRRSN